MAGSQRTRRFVRQAVLTAASTLLVVPAFVAGPAAVPAVAEPTSDDVRQRVLDLGEQLEVITEQYNAANIKLTDARAVQAQAQAKADALDGKIESLSGKVAQMASSVYRSAPVGQLTTVFTSDSPEQFLSQLSALDTLSARRTATLDGLVQASELAEQARAAATQAAKDAQTIFDDLQAKKSQIQTQLAEQQALLEQLTEQERAELFEPPPPDPEQPNPAPDVPATGAAKVAVDAALSRLGMPYVWAADGPETFDCSGLTMWAWAQAGVSLPHQSAMQYDVGTRVSRDELIPGDLVFFYSPIHHVGMYIGDGQMVHAPTSGDVVRIAPLDMDNYTGATRVG